MKHEEGASHTTPVEELVRWRLGKLAAVCLEEVVLVSLVLSLDVAHPQSASSD